MKNKYKINRIALLGTQFVEVFGETFCCEDLYELVGKNQFMSTIVFKKDAEASRMFGPSVTGVVFYNKDELELYRIPDEERISGRNGILKIDSPMPELTITQREDLKYGGFLVDDIEYITFMSLKRDVEHYDSGEKKVPNIISIPLEDDPKVDPDILYQNYIASKINSKVELIPYEKEKFIGITLAINDGHIDSRLLDYLGYSLDQIQNCQNIWYHLYQSKERINNISKWSYS